MKIILKIFVSFAILGGVTHLTANSALAACTSRTVDPASGQVGTTFTVRLEGCTAGNYQVSLFKGGPYQTYSAQSVGSNAYVAVISGLPEGTYSATYNEVGQGGTSVGNITVTPQVGATTTRFECQTVNNMSYCFKCTFNGTTKISCTSPSSGEMGSCPAACKLVVPGGSVGVGMSANIQGSCPADQIETGIGCIPIGSPTGFAAFFLRWGLGIAGGVAMLVFAYASFMLMTSAGDPKRLQTGKELLFSVISGIIMLVFSMFILNLLGVNILGLFA